MCCALALLMGAPAIAHADKSHECVSDVIDATVAEDGSLHVLDARTYEFEGTYTLTAAVLDPPPGGQAIVHGVSVIDERGTRTTLAEVPFQAVWRRSGGSASGSYAIDVANNTVYAFSTTSDARKTFVFDFTYTNAVTRYDDASVLYWQFVGPNWDVDTQNVTASVRLPVPAGQSVQPGENVFAFGHGNINGTVTFADDGAIEFDAKRVRQGSFAEMRVAFPPDWTPAVAAAKTVNEDVMPQIMDEEQQWQQQTQMQRIIDVLLLVVPLLISLACIIAAIFLFLRYGREHKPSFDGEYWRDVPAKGLNPAVIARIWRWNKHDANDLTAVLMHLSNLGAVRITSEKVVEERKILRDKEHVIYRLALDPERLASVELDEVDQGAVYIVFEQIGSTLGGSAGEAVYPAISFEDIAAYADENAQEYVNALERWQGKLDVIVDKRGFFERTGERLRGAFVIAGVILIALGIGSVALFENLLPLIGLLPGAIALLVFSIFMPRRSQEAVDIQARCEALKRWFKGFTALDEAVPMDAKVWGELLVYAYIFGVADQVVKNLNRVAPELWTSDAFAYGMLWYYNPYHAMHAGAAMGSTFGNVFENTMSSAQSIISQASGSGGNFGGAGGGFSSFGGGGFGGGGGGFSR